METPLVTSRHECVFYGLKEKKKKKKKERTLEVKARARYSKINFQMRE